MAAKQWTVEANPPPSQVHGVALQAIRMALKYQHRTPTVAELMADHNMSRATAYRWVASFKTAKGEA
jgi:hypothetical protein